MKKLFLLFSAIQFYYSQKIGDLGVEATDKQLFTN